MMRLHAMPAGEGDALWLEWGAETTHRMIIDMGRSSHGKVIRQMLMDLPEDERVVDLLIVTHVDRDHIEGVLSGFAKIEESSGTDFKEIWFNGWNHLHGLNYTDNPPLFNSNDRQQIVGGGVQTYGAVQGETLTPWLVKSEVWNKSFDGYPIVRSEDSLDVRIDLPDGLSVTILGPTQSILSEFIDEWRDQINDLEEEKDVSIHEYVIQQVGAGVQTLGRAKPNKPTLGTVDDLNKLARKNKNKKDTGPANGSSICIVVEYEGKRLLLTGDAHSDNLLESLNLLDSENPVPFDLVKLPHHGSEKNVTAELISKLDCEKFLISTSGSYFYHPDATAVARIIANSVKEAPEILFNVPSDFNLWWKNTDWQQKYNYTTNYGDEEFGLLINL